MELESRIVALEQSLDRQRKNQYRPALHAVCGVGYGDDVCGERVG